MVDQLASHFSAPRTMRPLALLPSRLPLGIKDRVSPLPVLTTNRTPSYQAKGRIPKNPIWGFLSVPNFKISVRKRSDIRPISEVSSGLGSDLYRSKFFYVFGMRRHLKLLEMVLRALPPDFHDSSITCGECA